MLRMEYGYESIDVYSNEWIAEDNLFYFTGSRVLLKKKVWQ